MTPELLTAFGQFGPLGLMIAYLIWREHAGGEARRQIEKERIEADKALAASLSAMTVTLQHMDQRLK